MELNIVYQVVLDKCKCCYTPTEVTPTEKVMWFASFVCIFLRLTKWMRERINERNNAKRMNCFIKRVLRIKKNKNSTNASYFVST